MPVTRILYDPKAGRALYNEGGGVTRLKDNPDPRALGLLKDLYERAAPEETPEWHYDEVAAYFREGRAAMSTDWPGGF